MMENGMLENLIKELVPEKKIDEVIGHVVRERLEYEFDQALQEKAREMVNEFSDKLILKKLDDLLGKQVITNDGFGSRKEYADFDSFVTNYIGRMVKSNYDLERKVASMVKDRLDRYCKEVVAESNRDLAKKVFEKIADDQANQEFTF